MEISLSVKIEEVRCNGLSTRQYQVFANGVFIGIFPHAIVFDLAQLTREILARLEYMNERGILPYMGDVYEEDEVV
jgi:hypothetical protein